MFAGHRFPIAQTFDCILYKLHRSAGFTKRLGRGTRARKKVEEEENKDILEESNKERVRDGDDQR